jgi:mRNA interferase MazF
MPSIPEPLAGEAGDLAFDPRVGHEKGGYRPALVKSNDFFNRGPNALHIVVPITGTDRGVRYHLGRLQPEGGLTKQSMIMCDQVRAHSVLRFRRFRGAVSAETLVRVRAMVWQCLH